MPRKHSSGSGGGGKRGGKGLSLGGGLVGCSLSSPAFAATPLSIRALAAEVGAIVGSMRVQLGDGHVHLQGPLDAAGVRGLVEECEDGPARLGAPCMAIVVRRYTPGTVARCTDAGELVTLPVPDALGCHMYIRHYRVMEGGQAQRTPVAAVQRAHNFHFRTGQPLGEEPGLGYE